MRDKILFVLCVCFIIFLFATNQYPKAQDIKDDDEVVFVNQETNNADSNICDECGNRFYGNGYTEVSDGVWTKTEEPYQSFICSKSCGYRHTEKWNKQLGKYSSSSDGRIYDKDACGLCGGTGIEVSRSSLLGEQRRVCPMCDGKGKQSY